MLGNIAWLWSKFCRRVLRSIYANWEKNTPSTEGAFLWSR